MLEALNGKLRRSDGGPPSSGGGGGGSGGASSAAAPSGFVLRKFDMSESRFLRDRYNIGTLPMYLMYYGGKLAYASSTLNGFGSSEADLIAQAKLTTTAAQHGQFLPDDFKFGATSDKSMSDFVETIAKTCTSIGH